MAVLNKDNIARPTAPKEVVDVIELGGEVIVRGVTLTQRIDLANNPSIAKALSYCVVDAENNPIFNEQEWEDFGANQFAVCMSLFQKAKKLSGLDSETIEKK
jgi:hypothetical protein